MREHNLGLVARTVAESVEPPSRADLAVRTGLNRATVSLLVDVLLGAGILAELEPVYTQRAGRPSIPLVPARGRLVALGLEVSVGYLGGLVLDLAGEIVDDRIELANHSRSEPVEVLARLGDIGADLARRARARGARVVGTGLALPGLVDADGSVLRLAPNLGWREVAPRPLLNAGGWLDEPDRLDLVAGNDADFAAVAEAALMTQVERRDRNFLYVSGDFIGVGAAIVLEGTTLRGRHGWAGEFGHILIDPAGGQCRCGAVGCLEVYAGTNALLRSAGLRDDESIQVLANAAAGGDPRAVAALDGAAAALGTAVADAINLLDISDVVLGGQYAPLTDLLAPGVRAAAAERVLSAPWAPPTVRGTAVGELAAMVGAARRVLDRVLNAPQAWL